MQKNPQRAKRRAVSVNGMLLLNKPAGLSSNQALQRAKRLLNADKAGHTGSLDPIATGLLPLCFGETTKISSMFLHADKSYWTQLQLGVATATGDREGAIEQRAEVQVSRAQLEDALAQFRGAFAQTPPMYSALKRDGKPLYKLAREGLVVDREPRMVQVSELTLLAFADDCVELRLACSRGFYVRALAHDLGVALGCGAHVRELARLGVGGFVIEDAISLTQLEAIGEPAERRKFLLPTDRALAHLPEVHLPENAAFYLRRGQSVRAPQDIAGLVRVYSRDGFVGLGECADGKLAPKRLFNV